MKKDEQEKNIQKNNVKKFPFKTSVEGKTEKQTFENLKKKASDDLEHKDSEEGNQNGKSSAKERKNVIGPCA